MKFLRWLSDLPWKWALAVACFSAAILATTAGISRAEVVDLGAIRLDLGQVLLLVALGAAWGENRNRLKNLEQRMDHLEHQKDHTEE